MSVVREVAALAGELARRASAVVRRDRAETDFEREMQSHLDMATEDFQAQGMTRREARRAALRSFGSVGSAKEQHREQRGLPALETLARDVRLALRTLRRDAGLTTFAVLTIALGIGASTLVFSVAGALLIRPLPFDDPKQLVWIANGESTNLSAQTVQVNNLVDLAERSQTLSEIGGFFAFYGAGDLRVNGPQGPQRLTGVPVTGNFFSLLGVPFQIGRNFTAAEVHEGDSAVILSHRLWQQRFAGDPDILGQRMQVNSTPATIVGVLPAGFDFQATFTPGKPADFFTPYALSEQHNRSGNTLALIGRLDKNAGLPMAQEESARLAEQIAAENVEQRRNSFDPRLAPLRERISGSVEQPMLLLSGAVAFLMLIVCANLSNLLLARASGRRKEMAVHLALGAGRIRVLRRLLIESLLLSLAGATLGLVLALFGTELLAQIEGTSIPLLHDVRVDATALGFTTLLALVVSVLFGLAPALQASNTAPAAALGESSRSTPSLKSRWMRQTLVVSEVALACVLLMGVGLLLRSFLHVLESDLGFETRQIVSLRVDPARDTSVEEKAQYYEALLQQVRSVPGVAQAGLTDALPLGDNFGWRTWDARVPDSEDVVHPLVRLVDEGYFSTLGLTLLRGRFFDSSDHGAAQRVTVVNTTLADALWPEQEAVGQTMRTSGHDYRVVGVVADAKYFALERESGAEMYFPLQRIPYANSVDLVVRSAEGSAAMLPGLRAALTAFDPELPINQFKTMGDLVDQSTFPRRSVLVLLTGFAAFGLILASLGIYSVVSYTVGQRRQEMGVRLAFGATGTTLGRSVVLQTLAPTLVGVTIGSLAAWMLARSLSTMLYGVGAIDPLTSALVVGLLGLCACFASFLPARRTARLNAVEALRVD